MPRARRARRPSPARSNRRRSPAPGRRFHRQHGRAAWVPTASGSTSAPIAGIDAGRQRHEARRSTTTSSARPPSTDTPCSRLGAVTAQLVSPARQRSHSPHHAFGCTATTVPSSSTPANSWPRVTGRFHAARCRSDAQMPHDRTRTRTGSIGVRGHDAPPRRRPRPPRHPTPALLAQAESCRLAAEGVRGRTPLRCQRHSGLGVERRWRISVSTARWRSSPARAAASGASTRCSSPAGARSWSSTTSAARVDGSGGDAGPGQQVVDEIKAAGGEAVARHQLASPRPRAARRSCRPRSTRSAASTSSSTTPASCATRASTTWAPTCSTRCSTSTCAARST